MICVKCRKKSINFLPDRQKCNSCIAIEEKVYLTLINEDCKRALKRVHSNSIRCCVTSPPYWALRDYGFNGQLGLEETPKQYVESIVKVFDEVKRVLRPNGTLWLVIGDTYAHTNFGQGGHAANSEKQLTNTGSYYNSSRYFDAIMEPKNLLGIPWKVAFALQERGWYLRSDIIWNKLNPIPESVLDRPTKSHEYVFLLTKLPSYYYNADAIKEDATSNGVIGQKQNLYVDLPNGQIRFGKPNLGGSKDGFRNKRTVWSISSGSFSGAHFATFPEKLVETCLLAGSKPGDIVLDPFAGSGTVGKVALKLGRSAILIEANSNYVNLIFNRCGKWKLKKIDNEKYEYIVR